MTVTQLQLGKKFHKTAGSIVAVANIFRSVISAWPATTQQLASGSNWCMVDHNVCKTIQRFLGWFLASKGVLKKLSAERSRISWELGQQR